MICPTKLKRHPVYMKAANRQRQAINEAEWWNSAHVVGAPVCVHRDNGEIVRSITRSEASVIGDTAVVFVHGISGAYALFRIHDRAAGDAPKAPTDSMSVHDPSTDDRIE